MELPYCIYIYGAKTRLSHWQYHLVTHKDKLKDSEDIKTEEKSGFFTYDPFARQKLIART
jgi:hypothetical protein